MKAEFKEYAGRAVLEITAKTKQEKKDLERYINRCEKGFEVFDRNQNVYPTCSPIRFNCSRFVPDGCEHTYIESANESETKDAVYAKSLEIAAAKKKWWQFWK